ncbi:hypothetical protein D3C87_1200940 [compost metagenome]
MADEERLLVVVGVHEPACYAVCAVAAHFAGTGVEHVHAVDLDHQLPVGGHVDDVALAVVSADAAALGVQHIHIRLAEDHEQVALAGVLQVFGHVQVGIHACLEHVDAAQLAEFAGRCIVVEGAGDEHVEIGIASFAGGIDQVSTGNGTELRADQDTGTLHLSVFQIAAFGADQVARPWLQ